MLIFRHIRVSWHVEIYNMRIFRGLNGRAVQIYRIGELRPVPREFELMIIIAIVES